MTVEINLWQLILASLVPTVVLVFRAGRAEQRIQDLEADIGRLEPLKDDVRKIMTDVAWIKESVAYLTNRVDKR